MKYEDFEKFIKEKCMYDTIYEDSDGRQILIIQMLDAYGMVDKAPREWVGLTKEELSNLNPTLRKEGARWAEVKLKEKNT